MSANGHLTADERGVILHCQECHTANRIPFARLHGVGRCGRCKASLPRPGLPVVVETAAVFSALARTSSLPVFIDFWAPWCGPCKTVAPEVEKLAAMAAGELLVAKVDTEDQPEIAGTMSIRSIPTFAVFAGGREQDRVSGAMAAPELRAFARRAVADPKGGP
ncbi:MAG TPA: thioredoxin domain-containing protein [Opitutaceae bacterium]|nr:thioredoxin domain-containing protein [Opitutaceae bacterium]